MYSKADFINWLKSLPPATDFTEWPYACPIAMFTSTTPAFGHADGPPEWAVEVINRFEERSSRSVADVLEIAKSATYTQHDFVEWLRSLPPDTTFCQDAFRSQTCPIAMFSGDPAIPSGEYDAWVRTFIRRYDERLSTSLADALEIAETL
jgi:hypothetical protein